VPEHLDVVRELLLLALLHVFSLLPRGSFFLFGI
jgi:hypothetical protein